MGCWVTSLVHLFIVLQYQFILVRVTMDLEPILRTLGIETDSERVTGHHVHTFTHSFIPTVGITKIRHENFEYSNKSGKFLAKFIK